MVSLSAIANVGPMMFNETSETAVAAFRQEKQEHKGREGLDARSEAKQERRGQIVFLDETIDPGNKRDQDNALGVAPFKQKQERV